MESNDDDDESFDERRAFLHELQNHDDIVTTDYTRDGFQTLYVAFAPDSGFEKPLQERAQQLGYRIEHLSGAVYRLSQE